MSTPYLSEIRLLAFNFAPKGWALCNGQLLPIAQYQALFSLLGTAYGGNGVSNFALPNLQGQVPLHYGTAPGGSIYALGEATGEAAHTLLAGEMPAHTHMLNAKAATADLDAAGVVPGPSVVLAEPETSGATKLPVSAYGSPASGAMAAGAVGITGANQPHPNQQPYTVLNFCIALTGIFPSRG